MILVLVVTRCHRGNRLFTDYGKQNNRTLLWVEKINNLIEKEPSIFKSNLKYPPTSTRKRSIKQAKMKHLLFRWKPPQTTYINQLISSVIFGCSPPPPTKKKKKRRKCNQRSGLLSFTRKEENERRIVIKERIDDRRLNNCLPGGRGFAVEEVDIFSAIHWECLRFCGLCGQ